LGEKQSSGLSPKNGKGTTMAFRNRILTIRNASLISASILGFGMLIPAIYFVWSMRYGKHAEANPWHLPGLEWRTQSPPPTENFEQTPIVTWEAYEFAPSAETEVIGKFAGELETA